MSTVSRTRSSGTSQRSSSARRSKSSSTQRPQGSQRTRNSSPRDQVRLSKDAGAQPIASQTPNFASWANPSAAPSASPLKAMSGDTLSRKARGTRVAELQKHLNQSGAGLEVDGKFGPLTQKAVKKFQKQHGLQVDGKVGPETMKALNQGISAQKPEAAARPEEVKKPEAVARPEEVKKPEAVAKAEGIPQLAGKDMTPQERYDHYAAMVEAAGGKLDPKKPTVLGLRGLGLDGARHDSGKNTGSGDDTFVVLGRDKKGNPVVTELPGSTHAAVKKGPIAGGVAQLRPGNYEATRRHDYKGREAWALNGGGNVPVYRDRNRDGHISEAEKAHALANNTKGDGILFHRDRGVSIGCQVLSDQVLGQLTRAVGGGNFHYTLIDANRPQ